MLKNTRPPRLWAGGKSCAWALDIAGGVLSDVEDGLDAALCAAGRPVIGVIAMGDTRGSLGLGLAGDEQPDAVC